MPLERFRSLRVATAWLLAVAFFSGPAQATTVAELHFSDVVAKAELVFEGRVTQVEAQQTGPRMIKTLVTFEVLDVMKGQVNGTQMTLHFTGGRVGQRQLRIADMQTPEVGESGIYFVESLQNNLVHPLVGWSQGHFLINRQNAENGSQITAPTVETASGQQVRELTTRPEARPAETMPLLAPGAAARGVQLREAGQPQQGLTVDAFKSRVREIVREQEAGL